MGAVRASVPAALAGERVDRAVALLTGLSRSAVVELLARGAVRVDGALVAGRSRRVAEGAVLEVEVPPAAADTACLPDPTVEVPVVHGDDQVIVVDKPAHLVVHPGPGHSSGTLVQGLLARFPELASVGDPGRPGVVHRLDRGTSGLLVAARTPTAYASLTAQLAERRVERGYMVLVRGHLEAPTGVIDAPVGRAERHRTRMAVSARGREARTCYRLRREYSHPEALSLLECRLETGRTHQIRVHFAAVGHPVVGDSSYGGSSRLRLARPFLHAYRLAFDHPASGERVELESRLPDDLQQVLARLA